ncbi:hypothetical protein VTK73DRAFT_1620 [Phialemonium thermophilum]|uniref:Uncharacterized protein n=1 Tax=Phialemonium thermophilum TaxID=223376 RepID=A0ABR3X9H6_9PEZI
MPSSPASPAAADSSKLKTVVESHGLRFHIRTKNAKWACTLQDRAAYEKQKAARSSSSASVSTASSSASSTVSTASQ